MRRNPPLPGCARLLKLVDRFPGRRLLILGDFMLDHFIRGQVERISPEAPVPVVRVTQETFVPGGAGNVAANLAALSAKPLGIGVIGDDEAGRTLRNNLESRGVDTRHILTDPGRPTTVKVRVIAEHQQVVRYDRERGTPLPRDLKERVLASVRDEIARMDGVILSDYGKGMLAPEILSFAIASARRLGIPVVVDPKVEHFLKYRGVTCLTPNVAEAWAGMRLNPRPEESALEELGRRILRRLKAQAVLITRGDKGMSLFTDASVTRIPTTAREVFDVTGAGDTVASALTLSLASGAKVPEAAVISNLAAGIVVGKLGTATVSLQELQDAIRRNSK